jgi:hypothetical protein
LGFFSSCFEFGEGGGTLGGGRVGKATSVEFDDGGLEGCGGFDLMEVGVEKEAGENFRLVEFFDDGAEGVDLGGGIETAFGGDFRTVFWDEADLGRLQAEGEVEHGWGGGHFEVELFAAFATESENVVVLNVATIFAEVNGDRVCPDAEAEKGGGNGVGFRHDTRDGDAVPGLPEGGEVIDVYAKPNHTFILSQISTQVECF